MDKYLSVKTGIIENNHLFTVDIDTWEFLEWDLDTDTYKIVAELMPDEAYKLCWIQKVVKYDNSFFFLQRNSKQLIEYNVNEKEVIRYGTEYVLGDDVCLLYSDAFVWNNRLYMLPYSVDGVITVFDLKSKKYSQEYEMKKVIVKSKEEYSNERILSYHMIDQYVWFCMEKTNLITSLNLKTMESKRFELDTVNGLSRVMGNGERIFCTAIDTYEFYEYDDELKRFQSCNIQKEQENQEEKGYAFAVASQLGEEIVAIPKEMNCMDVILKDNECGFTTIAFPYEFCGIFELRMIETKFSNYIVEKNKLYLLPFSSNGVLEIDLEDFKIKYHCLKIEHKDAAFSLIQYKKIMIENSKIFLSDLFYVLNQFQLEKNNETKLIGKMIYNQLS